MLSYLAHLPSTLSEKLTSSEGRGEASQKYYFEVFHVAVLSRWESGARLRRTTGINFISAGHCNPNILSLQAASDQSLGKDINKVFSVPCGRFMSVAGVHLFS